MGGEPEREVMKKNKLFFTGVVVTLFLIAFSVYTASKDSVVDVEDGGLSNLASEFQPKLISEESYLSDEADPSKIFLENSVSTDENKGDSSLVGEDKSVGASDSFIEKKEVTNLNLLPEEIQFEENIGIHSVMDDSTALEDEGFAPPVDEKNFGSFGK